MKQNAALKSDDVSLITDLRSINPSIADQYLEYVVVSKRNPSKGLHEQLLGHLLDNAEELVADEGIQYHLEELAADYKLQSEPPPYCLYLAEVAPDTPIKTVRLKLLLFLQGSPFYELENAMQRLRKLPTLTSELAVVLGRLRRHQEALTLLAHDVGDSISAQTYCTQGGEIIPPRIAHAISSHVPELVEWATLGDVGRKRRGTVDAKTQEVLVMDLLGVYMKDR